MTATKTLTREEVRRRWEESKRRKRERVNRIVPSLKEDFRRVNGKEATIIEVW